MSILIPSPADLAARFSAALAQKQFTAIDGSPVRLDATAPATFEQVLTGILALGDYETYLFLRDYALEFMVTTATTGKGGLLPEHAKMWDVPRNPAQAAIGRVIITATQPVTVPKGALLTVSGTTQYNLNQAVVVPPYQETPAPITCTTTGPGGNLAGNTSLTLVNPVPGIVSVVVDGEGIAGGSEIEEVESWRSRIIDTIRNPYNGGSVADYINWAKNAGAAFVNVVPQYLGEGTVGVIIALPGPTAPTGAEIQRVQNYIDSVKPVCGHATVSGAVILPQNLQISLNPDTLTARQQVQASVMKAYSSIGLGGTLYREVLENAIFLANGPKNTLIAPHDNISFPSNVLPILGEITWGGVP